jgi:hypothetical protein
MQRWTPEIPKHAGMSAMAVDVARRGPACDRLALRRLICPGNSRSLRAHQCGCIGSGARDRGRQLDRAEIPARRPGFRRLVLPKGFAGPIKTAQNHDVSMWILEAVETVNDTRKHGTTTCARRRVSR